MDYDPVKTELAAVNQVFEQYGKPLMLGLIPDVDAALKTYRDKLKSAGIEKLLTYVKEQSNQFLTKKELNRT